MIKYKCPECGELMDYLNYQTGGYCYGSYDIGSQEYSGDSSEFDGETNYDCPECSYDISDPNDLEQVEVDEDDNIIETDENDNPIRPKRIQPVITNGIFEEQSYRSSNSGEEYVVCSKCKTKNIVEERDTNAYVNCTKCKAEISTDENFILNSRQTGIIWAIQ